MKRVVVPELLDTDSGSAIEVEKSLADLRWLNRYFGGVSTTTTLLRKVIERAHWRRFAYLDVAGASGDVARGAQAALRDDGIEMDAAIIDRSATHLPGRDETRHAAIVADAFRLPFQDGSFDVVGNALFLHHLEPEEIVVFINEMLRVCRRACIVNDLRRGIFHLVTAQAGRVLYGSAVTAHDAPASVRRAYTLEEMRAILQDTCAKRIDYGKYYFFRMGIVLWKDAA